MSLSSAKLRERAPLPEGTLPIGAALLIAGIATYAFFKVGNVAVGGDEAFEPIASLWFATFALAPGFFLPLEQELGRAIAHRRAIASSCLSNRSWDGRSRTAVRSAREPGPWSTGSSHSVRSSSSSS